MANLISQIPTVMLLLAALLSITPAIQSLCSDIMVTSLTSSGFAIFAHARNLTSTITASNATLLTFLAPPDSALVNGFLHSESLHGHIAIAGVLSYQTLLTLPILHQNATLVVGIDGQRVSFNDVLVTFPNLYIDGSCAVHGVEGSLVPIPSLLADSMNQELRLCHLKWLQRSTIHVRCSIISGSFDEQIVQILVMRRVKPVIPEIGESSCWGAVSFYVSVCL